MTDESHLQLAHVDCRLSAEKLLVVAVLAQVAHVVGLLGCQFAIILQSAFQIGQILFGVEQGGFLFCSQRVYPSWKSKSSFWRF